MKKMTFNISFFVCSAVAIVLLLGLGDRAFSQTMKKINLNDAIELALTNNLDLQSERINLELAKNNVKTANKLQNPEINLFYNYGASGKGNPQQIGLSETLEIAKRAPRKHLAQANLLKKDIDVHIKEFELEMDVRETYVDLVSAKTILQCLKEQEKLLEEFLSLSKKQTLSKPLDIASNPTIPEPANASRKLFSPKSISEKSMLKILSLI